MKNIFIGIVIGLALGGGVAWAGGQFTWVFPNGRPAGTPNDPVYIQSV